MVLVRMVLQAKPGKASETVERFKQSADVMRKFLGPDVRVRILTDLSGPFDTVVQEMEFESLAEWERIRTAMFASPESQERQDSEERSFLSGRAEFYTIEATF